MLFAAICIDKPDSVDVRMSNRPAHLDHLKAQGAAIRVGGPLMQDDTQTPAGSLLLIEAASQDEAKAILDADPYAAAGLFQSVTLMPWKQVIGGASLD